MCFEYGSEEANAPCVLCKAFGDETKACPHQQGIRVCQNRTNHPQAAMVHFTNAEYGVFNGCGYCKWVTRHPTEKANNKGWPGCCRRPQMNEIEYVEAKDWPGVSAVFGIHNPYQPRERPARPISSNAPRRLQSAAIAAGIPLKRGSVEVHGTKEAGETRTASASGSPHRRDSPKITEPPVKSSPRREYQDIGTTAGASQTPPRSSIEIASVGHYRSNSKSSPKETQQTITTTYVVADDREGGFSTRAISKPIIPAEPVGFTYGQPIPRPSTLRGARSPASAVPENVRLTDISRGFEGMSLSSASSNRDSMTTVTSDGGFTDYLSEESEAELQRQAEERAMQLRRTRAEEAEFNAARRGLQNIDLRTPASWTLSATRSQPYDPSAYAGR